MALGLQSFYCLVHNGGRQSLAADHIDVRMEAQGGGASCSFSLLQPLLLQYPEFDAPQGNTMRTSRGSSSRTGCCASARQVRVHLPGVCGVACLGGSCGQHQPSFKGI